MVFIEKNSTIWVWTWQKWTKSMQLGPVLTLSSLHSHLKKILDPRIGDSNKNSKPGRKGAIIARPRKTRIRISLIPSEIGSKSKTLLPEEKRSSTK